MKLELQEKLFLRHPRFYRRTGSSALPFDERGIECGDGWMDLIDRLSSACEQEIVARISQGVAKELWPRVAQIKEKMGTLRFYVNGAVSDELRSRIRQAEEESSRTCEGCGSPGQLREGSWHTYCNDCFQRSQARS